MSIDNYGEKSEMALGNVFTPHETRTEIGVHDLLRGIPSLSINPDVAREGVGWINYTL